MQTKTRPHPTMLAMAMILAVLAGGCRTAPPRERTAIPSPQVARLAPSRPVPVIAASEDAPDDPAPQDVDAPAASTSDAEPAVEEPMATAPIVRDGYQVHPGDSLKIEVFQEADISRIFKVSEAGTINHPLLGKVVVTNLTLDAVEVRVRDLLAADYLVDPKVIVTLERSAGRPIIVFGEVKTPGVYEIPPGEKLTLLQLVARAGGFTDIAAIDKVRIIRPHAEGEETLRVRVSELLQGKDRKEIELLPGDVLIVPRTIF